MDDLCEGWSDEIRQGVMDLGQYDEQTWKRLEPQLVEKGEREKVDRFKKLGGGGYGYVLPEEREQDPIGTKTGDSQVGEGQRGDG